MRASDERSSNWSSVIARQAASGGSVAGWCRDQEINVQQFHYWRKRLGSAPELTARSGGPEPVQWLAVDPVSVPAARSGVTLRVGQVSIDVDAGFDRFLLSEVLGVLESRC
jgi:hypothetical protein